MFSRWSTNSWLAQVKFGYSEKATKFEKIFRLKFDVTEQRQILNGRFFQILWSSQNIRTLLYESQHVNCRNISIEKILRSDHGKGSLISESYSLWLKSLKRCQITIGNPEHVVANSQAIFIPWGFGELGNLEPIPRGSRGIFGESNALK